MIALLVIIGVLGLAIGSFLNVVIYRVPRGDSVARPASRCPQCGAAIRARHNVPVLGWLLLRGRCADCGTSISARYPLVEAATGVLFAALAWRFGGALALPAFLYLAAVAVALAMIDIDVRRLPNRIVLPSYVIGGVLLAGAGAAQHDARPILRGVVAMVALFAFYYALAVAYPGGMGFGDVKLAGLLGLYLGFLGWGWVVVGTFTGFLLGALVGVGLMLARRAGRRTALPFGPYMLAGALLAVFVAAPVVHWYAAHVFALS
jgi:leader peptidase (prepilin peptidase)/N-methyltransferase